MPDAAARFDDMADEAPARRPKPARKRANGRKRGGRGRVGRLRYAHWSAIGLSAVVTVGILVNALAMQHSRHPAPLFGKAIQLGDTPAPAAAAAMIAPQPTPPTKAAPVPLPAPKPATQTASVPATPEATAPAPHLPHRLVEAATSPARKGEDSIAKLLKTSGGAAEKKDGAKTVLAAQQALVKLGFAVKADGTFGPTTHAAIEAFERDQKLPVTGALNPRLVKHLSAESGVAIN